MNPSNFSLHVTATRSAYERISGLHFSDFFDFFLKIYLGGYTSIRFVLSKKTWKGGAERSGATDERYLSVCIGGPAVS